MKKKLSFAIFGNEYQTKKSSAVRSVLSLLEERGAKVYMERLFHDFLVSEQGLLSGVAGTFTELDFDVDFVVSMGGDGTFLKAANMVGERKVPIVGITRGVWAILLIFLLLMRSWRLKCSIPGILSRKATLSSRRNCPWKEVAAIGLPWSMR